MKIYQYPNCSTCRKAVKWLSEEGHDFTSVHIVDDAPDAATLKDLWERSGLDLKRFFNTSGQSYRKGGFKERLPAMSQDEKFEALAADGKLIKRPILDSAEAVLVGFKLAQWEEKVGGEEA